MRQKITAAVTSPNARRRRVAREKISMTNMEHNNEVSMAQLIAVMYLLGLETKWRT